MSDAQCPDGTPPPCAAVRTPAAPRREEPALDERTWIVVPFDNVSRGADIDWLRDASVNLLYLDLSRWRDIRVIDDKRVADFLREVPGASGALKLSLNVGLAVARRAGAGRLVMGDVLKIGSRTAVTATVFDVHRGTRVRSVREETAVQDSLVPLFGKLARRILAIAPPEGANVGAIGTSRVDAYQEYLAGVQELNRFDIGAARRHLERALELDTTFALAHYKLAIASLYDEAGASARFSQMRFSDTLAINNLVLQSAVYDLASFAKLSDDPARLQHAAAAARLSGSLPARERAMMNGLLAHIRKDYARACETFGTLVRADSSDVEALYGLGECLVQDDAVEAVGGDTTRAYFRSNWNTALRVLRRAITVDPSFHLAFDHVASILTAPGRLGCRREYPSVPCNDSAAAPRYRAFVRRDGDSLLIVPVPIAQSVTLSQQVAEADRTQTRRRNLEEARVAAEEWVAAGPREGRAHKTLAHILLRLGRLSEAEAQLTEAAADPSIRSDLEFGLLQLNLIVKRGRRGEAVRALDSIAALAPRGALLVMLGVWNSFSGRLAILDSALTEMLRPRAMPPLTNAYMLQATRVTLGVAGDSAAATERQIVDQFGGTCSSFCIGLIAPTLKFGLRLRRSHFPALDSTSRVTYRAAPALALSRGDTARLRAAARLTDSVSKALARSLAPEDGASAIAADAYLLLGDSLAALAAVRRMLDTTLIVTPLELLLPGGAPLVAGQLWPRGMLLRADLAAALGQPDEARLWYGRFLDLWSRADPEFQPLVARVRKAYLKVGGRE